MSAFPHRFWAGYVAVVLTLCLLLRSDLVPAWGVWYSHHLPLRWQTERLLQGQVALSHQPEDLSWDMAWDNGAVQQVWGLAVPLWRLLFEALARFTGHPAFPDRLAFALAVVGAAYCLIRFNLALAANMAVRVVPWGWLGVVPVVLFPPFLALCASRFLAYEEVVAYGFLAALLLLVWAVRLSWRPRAAGFLGLALATGLIGFIRPTLVVYGAASLFVAGLAVWTNRRDHGFVTNRSVWRLLYSGGALFCLGLGLLFWSNAARFGRALEFGHSLNLNGLDSMRYASRFAYPFRTEPLGSATRELFGLLFFARPAASADPDRTVSFPGHSSTFRWREIYFSTYDLSYVPVLVVAWAWLGTRWLRRVRGLRAAEPREAAVGDPIEGMALWSLIAFVLLALFYLRAPFASSRYLLDFGPAVAAALWAATWLGFRWIDARRPRAGWLPWAISAAVLGWWGWEVYGLKLLNDRAQPIRESAWEQLARQLEAGRSRVREAPLPSAYSAGFDFRSGGIPFNGQGWQTTGRTKSCVALLVRDPDCLVLHLAPGKSVASRPEDYDCIRAKIGLEFLKRESSIPTSDGMRHTFHGPTRKRYQKGIQFVFLGMVETQALSDEESPFRLLEVRWRRDSFSTEEGVRR